MNHGAIFGLRRHNQSQDGSAESYGQMLVDKPGKRLGQLAKTIGLDPAHAGLTSASEALSKTHGHHKPVDGIPDKPTRQEMHGELTLGTVFANEVIRRLEAGDEAALDSEGNPKDSEDLRDSLAQTMDWIRERYGDDTAAAAAGMILQSTSSGVNEDTLGEGLLNTLKFIDRNFGINAGDEAIAKFNGSINQEINDYFDNGKDELFYAVESSGETASPVQNLGTRIVMDATQQASSDEDAVDPTTQLLDKLKEDLDESADLQDLSIQIDISINISMNFAINAYSAQPGGAEPQFTSQAV